MIPAFASGTKTNAGAHWYKLMGQFLYQMQRVRWGVTESIMHTIPMDKCFLQIKSRTEESPQRRK